MESVAFYSYKGGVGRSLLLSNTARFLALSGRRVVALDLDFEAPGLHYKTGTEKRVKTGAVQLLQRSLEGDLPTLDEVREAAIDVPMSATHGGWLRLLAAGPAPTAEYWADLGLLQERLAANQGTGLLEAVLDLQARIEEVWSPDVLLVDARTGVTGLGGIATMALCDRVVMVTTRARESLDGVVAIAQSLGETPTLRGGRRRLEFVVSRVQGTETVDDRELRERLGEYFELPHDRYDGGGERLLGDGSLPPSPIGFPQSSGFGRVEADSLLARTLRWISKLFPTQAESADRARTRLVAVERAWLDLTEPYENVGKWLRRRLCWARDMLATEERFTGADGVTRTADIVARLGGGELAMVLEHVDDEPGPEIALWWIDNVPVRLVVLQWQDDPYQNNQWMTQRRFVSREGASRVRDRGIGDAMSARWSLPSPEEFEVLRDLAELSVESMLAAAMRTALYDEQLVERWVRSVVQMPHGILRPEPMPGEAKAIVDGLAAIDEHARAKEIVEVCARAASHRRHWLHTGDDYLDHFVHDELCAPLCWRVPPRAFTELGQSRWHGPPATFHALRRLARFMGLGYDPDAIVPRDAPERIGDDPGIHLLVEGSRARELQFEWDADGFSRPSSHPRPVYHGHLGRYVHATGHIVLASRAIDAVANPIGRDPRYVGSVTLLHLCVLGMLHNGTDLDGQRWDRVSFGDDGVPPVVVVLAQFFVHRFLDALGDERMKDAFEALTEIQPPEYGVWRAMTHVSLEDGRAWMMSVRRGTGGPAPIDLGTLLRTE